MSGMQIGPNGQNLLKLWRANEGRPDLLRPVGDNAQLLADVLPTLILFRLDGEDNLVAPIIGADVDDREDKGTIPKNILETYHANYRQQVIDDFQKMAHTSVASIGIVARRVAANGPVDVRQYFCMPVIEQDGTTFRFVNVDDKISQDDPAWEKAESAIPKDEVCTVVLDTKHIALDALP